MIHSRIFLFLLFVGLSISELVLADEPDSVYLVSYTTIKDKGRSGLRFAWSADGTKWNLVGEGNVYLRCDYGSQKFINSPYLFQNKKGNWQCIWSLNDTVNQFASVTSKDLLEWGSQHYPFLPSSMKFNKPVVSYNETDQLYIISFISGTQYFKVTTADFKLFTQAAAISADEYKDDRVSIKLPDGNVTANKCKASFRLIKQLTDAWKLKQFKSSQLKENSITDSIRFVGLKPVIANIEVKHETPKPISDLLVGVFFEDINYASDGGLYAELLQNRDFEYKPYERLNNDYTWNSKHSWTAEGVNITFTIDSVSPVHPNNSHYAVLHTSNSGGSLFNSGYDGIFLKKGEGYDFSLFARADDNHNKELIIKLVDADGFILAQEKININSRDWKRYSTKLVCKNESKNARLEIKIETPGSLMLDIVSLFPQKTFKNRKNGMRMDIAESIAAIHPKFVRFPGGCVAHGDGIENIYRWKNTIGPIETRKPQPNIWRYHQSVGLGFYEYFQYCEDIGAEPLPIIAAGVPCQNSGLLDGLNGQQCGIPLNKMNEYIQDVLDLVEWANGPVTSKWGKLRADAGHPKPFNLKFIGIGNEDLISDVFEERFTMMYQAIKQKHPDISVIGTAGPTNNGTDYELGWKLAAKLNVPFVDEHYYENPGWFINNQNFYDNYDRNRPKVYLGEYASRGNTLYNALTEALYLISLERNGDIVHMASYAPLLASEKHTQWKPDLIYFNNSEVKPTVNYEVQKLFGNNAGNEYLPVNSKLSNNDEAVSKRFAVSIVLDTSDGSLIIKMVNLLPIATSVDLDLNNLSVGSKMEKSVLQGRPEDKLVPVIVTAVSTQSEFKEVLPPYSFTVWRIYK